jgi:hypothetical protein
MSTSPPEDKDTNFTNFHELVPRFEFVPIRAIRVFPALHSRAAEDRCRL